MQIFDEIKARGVEDIFFISMDEVSGLEAGAKVIFPNVVVQRCIVHMIRNAIKYVPTKGVEDIFFISMDEVSGLEAGAKVIFPNVVVQRCIVHMIRNAIKYVPTKNYKRFTQSLKKVYRAPSLKVARTAFETFYNECQTIPV